MPSQPRRIRSELPGGDPTLMNRVAWARRWSDRHASIEYATTAREKALSGTGKRSRAEQGMALRTLAWQARFRGDLDGAMSQSLSAETFLPESDFIEERAGIYSTLGFIHFARNRLDLANCAVDRGFWLLRDVPDVNVGGAFADLLLTRAAIQRNSGERARAGITLGRAREIATEELATCVEYCTAMWLYIDGEVDPAHKRATEALDTANAMGNQVILPYLQVVLGACSGKLGRADSAIEHFELGLQVADRDNDLRAKCFLLREYAKMDAERRNTDDALKKLKDAAKHAKDIGFAFERKRIALEMAELYEQADKYRESVEQYKLAWRLQNATRAR